VGPNVFYIKVTSQDGNTVNEYTLTVTRADKVGNLDKGGTGSQAFTKAPTPTISGTVAVGNKLTANVGTWSPSKSKGVKFTYKWYANGKEIKGATKNIYTVKAGDFGKKITVSVTAELTKYKPVTKASKATAAVANTFKKAPAPKITGIAKVGKTLKVTLGKWDSGAKFTYKWYANGKAIKGKAATKSSFKLTKAQKGKKITVKVTAKKAKYITVTKASKATGKTK
jgi:hypothetical protein